MAGQEQQRATHRGDEEEPETAAPPAAPQAQDSARDEGLDDLLDEIDGVLETNAQEFVHTFVQKGGQ